MPALFFDLHSHPGTKTLFKNDPNQITPWENVTVPDRAFGGAFDSQSSYEIIARKAPDEVYSPTNLLCIALHPPERGMVDQFIIKLASRIPPYKKYLETSRLHDMVNNIFDYQELLYDELGNMQIDSPPGKKKIKILKSFAEYDKDDVETLHIFFSVEGGHTYYGSGNVTVSLQAMLDNFTNLLKKRILVFFSGITHLTDCIFCNHAYGNKIAKEDNFIPVRYGLTKEGESLIDTIYSNNILVDIKHMSWVARQQFYRYRKERDNWKNKPIIASHIAFTGFHYKERNKQITGIKPGSKKNSVKVSYNKKEGVIRNTYFNPNSINFYDDDIVEIVKSGGLMGLILDLRVLGGKRKIIWGTTTEFEYISEEDFKDWEIQGRLLKDLISAEEQTLYGKGKILDDFEIDEHLAAMEEVAEMFPLVFEDGLDSEKFVSRPKEEIKYFINHLLKFQLIINEHATELQGINPWEHICIGSDFDGMISAIDCCKDAAHFKNFSEMLLQELPEYANQCSINLSLPAADIIENLFFNNAYNFLQKHFL